jgi:hypothetical protein
MENKMKLLNIALALALMAGATQALSTEGWISNANAKVIAQAPMGNLKAEGAKLKSAAEGLTKNPQFVEAAKLKDAAKLKNMIARACEGCEDFRVAVSPGGGDGSVGIHIWIDWHRPITVTISFS